MFRITDGKGFAMKFKNGWGVSVQFGGGNYCSNYDMAIGSEWEKAGSKGSCDAECAVFDPDGEMVEMEGWGDTVNGWMDSDEVAELIEEVKSL